MAIIQIPAMSFNAHYYFGTRTTVRHVYGAYRLPDGLNEGDEVTLVDFQPGYWHVEHKGERYRVAMSGVGDAGRLPKPNRPVHPGCKPRVRAPQELRAETATRLDWSPSARTAIFGESM